MRWVRWRHCWELRNSEGIKVGFVVCAKSHKGDCHFFPYADGKRIFPMEYENLRVDAEGAYTSLKRAKRVVELELS